MNHIFNNPEHKLDPLVNRYGSQEQAYDAILRGTESAVRSQGITGIFETQVNVGSEMVTVRGNVINGEIKIGTAFIP